MQKLKENKLKKLKDFIPLVIDIENTENKLRIENKKKRNDDIESNDDIDFNSPLSKTFKINFITASESTPETSECNRNNKDRNRRLNKTPLQNMIEKKSPRQIKYFKCYSYTLTIKIKKR